MVSTETAPIARDVEIGASADRVFRLLTEPAELVRWWPDSAEIDARVGGRFRFVFRGGEAVVNGEVTRFEPPRALGLRWFPSGKPDAETQIEFTVTSLADDRTRVEVVHSGWEDAPELRPLHDEGWTFFLGRLAEAA